MATRERIFDPLQRERMVTQLRGGLQSRTAAELREVARKWGWRLRGTGKVDLVEQLTGYLQDSELMSAATASLPPAQIMLLPWLVGLGSGGDVVHRLRVGLQDGSGIEMTAPEINASLRDLYDRGLLMNGPTGLEASPLYLEWLPPIRAEALRTRVAAPQPAAMTVEWIVDEVQRLLSAIEAEKPLRHRPPASARAPGAPQSRDRFVKPLQPRPGLLDADTLGAWGYKTPDREALAAFLAELLWALQVILVDPTSHIIPVPAKFDEWQRRDPVVQLQLLRTAWLTHPVRYGVDNWNELDMALVQMDRFDFRPEYDWNAVGPLSTAVVGLRQQVLSILHAVQADTWYSFERFCRLISELSRDPLSYGPSGAWCWTDGGKVLRAGNMPFDVWMATYGRVLAALLRGPASWLGFVDVDRKGKELSAVKTLSAVPPGDLLSIPRDALRFVPPDTVIAAKTWKAARLRAILGRIAREVDPQPEMKPDRASTTYRLDALTFRAFLQAGGGANEPIGELAAAGFPLPASSAEKLKRWEARNGRYQLYDDLAVIELAEDMAQAEVETIARLLGARLYEAAPRCLLVLDRDQAPRIVDELRRRGYTPKVTL